jgi:hypothetical protein
LAFLVLALVFDEKATIPDPGRLSGTDTVPRVLTGLTLLVVILGLQHRGFYGKPVIRLSVRLL